MGEITTENRERTAQKLAAAGARAHRRAQLDLAVLAQADRLGEEVRKRAERLEADKRGLYGELWLRGFLRAVSDDAWWGRASIDSLAGIWSLAVEWNGRDETATAIVTRIRSQLEALIGLDPTRPAPQYQAAAQP